MQFLTRFAKLIKVFTGDVADLTPIAGLPETRGFGFPRKYFKMIIYVPKFIKRTRKEIHNQAVLRKKRSKWYQNWLKKLHKKLMI